MRKLQTLTKTWALLTDKVLPPVQLTPMAHRTFKILSPVSGRGPFLWRFWRAWLRKQARPSGIGSVTPFRPVAIGRHLVMTHEVALQRLELLAILRTDQVLFGERFQDRYWRRLLLDRHIVCLVPTKAGKGTVAQT